MCLFLDSREGPKLHRSLQKSRIFLQRWEGSHPLYYSRAEYLSNWELNNGLSVTVPFWEKNKELLTRGKSATNNLFFSLFSLLSTSRKLYQLSDLTRPGMIPFPLVPWCQKTHQANLYITFDSRIFWSKQKLKHLYNPVSYTHLTLPTIA